MNSQAQEGRIRVVLVDAPGLYRASLGRYLASEPGFELAGECGTPSEAVQLLADCKPDVVLADLDGCIEPESDLIGATRGAGYSGQFLIVCGDLDAPKAAMALKLGALGIFLKADAPERLVQAIKRVAGGEAWIDQKVIRLLADHVIDRLPLLEDGLRGNFLQDLERDVLLGILEGFSNRQIGDRMRLSESRVKNIVQCLFSKAGVRTRGQLVRVAMDGSWDAARDVLKRFSDSLQPSSEPERSNMPYGQPVVPALLKKDSAAAPLPEETPAQGR
jgi:two-component system, NarL family, nitrate/nitrite response regulator NarL